MRRPKLARATILTTKRPIGSRVSETDEIRWACLRTTRRPFT